MNDILLLDTYQQLAKRTAPRLEGLSPEQIKLTISNFLLGLGGEAGEVQDYGKKVLFHEHPLDRDKLIRELGDVFWYMAMIADAYDITLSEMATANIQKLQARYPEGFDPARSRDRKESAA